MGTCTTKDECEQKQYRSASRSKKRNNQRPVQYGDELKKAIEGIFVKYDQNRGGLLEKEEIKLMITGINARRKNPASL
jgi:hypothetical protein